MGNTFSLMDLCSCGSPCPSCCNNCCPGVSLPTAIFVTINSGLFTHCANGTYELDYNSSTNKWEGTYALGTCGMNFTMKVYCSSSGTDCFGYLMDISFSDNCHSAVTGQAPDSCACSPFSLTYSLFGTSGCTGGISMSFTVTT